MAPNIQNSLFLVNALFNRKTRTRRSSTFQGRVSTSLTERTFSSFLEPLLDIGKSSYLSSLRLHLRHLEAHEELRRADGRSELPGCGDFSDSGGDCGFCRGCEWEPAGERGGVFGGDGGVFGGGAGGEADLSNSDSLAPAIHSIARPALCRPHERLRMTRFPRIRRQAIK